MSSHGVCRRCFLKSPNGETHAGCVILGNEIERLRAEFTAAQVALKQARIEGMERAASALDALIRAEIEKEKQSG